MPIKLTRTLSVLAVVLAWVSGISLKSDQNVPSPQTIPAAQPVSLLTDHTLFAVYGRAFNVAPILGRLGSYRGFKDMERDIQPWIRDIKSRNGKKGVIPGIHLIYAMATPCKPGKDCLLYLEGRVGNLVEAYIEPAAKRGWMVVLDTQIGKSNPVQQVKRILNKGYLKYGNVAIALDPEFHVYPGKENPGRPIGTLQSSQINEAQQMLDDYVREQKLQHKIILIVHQFGDANVDDGVPFMIKDKDKIRTYQNVELVFNMDGLGQKTIKAFKYNKITDASVYPFIKFRGIKIFFRNRWEKHGHFDKPPMTLDEIFGIKKVKGGVKMEPKPDVIIIA